MRRTKKRAAAGTAALGRINSSSVRNTNDYTTEKYRKMLLNYSGALSQILLKGVSPLRIHFNQRFVRRIDSEVTANG